ncbi:MAG: hypothetical protein ABL967_08290 [Bryobacteraceae bacterium]
MINLITELQEKQPWLFDELGFKVIPSHYILQFDSPFPVRIGVGNNLRAMLEHGAFERNEIRALQRGVLFRDRDSAVAFNKRFSEQ